MNALATVQSRLKKTADSRATQLALQWFSGHAAEAVSAMPANVTASEALRLWRTREKTAQANPLGIPELIQRLEALAPQRKVEQFSFPDTNSTASFFSRRPNASILARWWYRRTVSNNPRRRRWHIR